MPAVDRPNRPAPASFLAAASALGVIDQAVRAAHAAPDGDGRDASDTTATSAEQALATLLLLREVRNRLAGWEPALIEAARRAGASWADLAEPLGVTSRQAAERRYLRLRPGAAGSTGEERVKATRDRRAANRSVTAWARDNAADLRQLAGQITALTDLPRQARTPLSLLVSALADDDAASLVGPLADARPHLRHNHPDLAARIDGITRQTDRLRRNSDEQRRTTAT
ncbi:type III effector protein [Streptomyces sp. ISL-10]|uniref:type III effector protein n=1 Tax=Streptomyces sp. ISL-10 TaxID=2819172 RepID=UPI001BED2DE7|nr:type III effector protein [Streptomyces sp. ISL-10]MBT2365529.1 type III effector protein [Streptomyces sp. ISL-10]